MRPAALFLLLPVLGLSVGCARTLAPEVELPTTPEPVRNLDEFEVALNRFALIPGGSQERAAHREPLERFLIDYMQVQLDAGSEAEALSALEYALGLYTPAELRTAPTKPALAQRAHDLYGLVARRGAEDPSMLALAVEQRFGDEKARAEALKNWERLEAWVTRNGPYSSEPLLRHEGLERSLEQVAAVFPSPFVTKRLADLYVARFQTARKAQNRGRGIGSAAQRRMEVTGYLLLRLYLRADDFRGAAEAMNRVELDPPVAKLREVVVDAIEPRRSAMPLLALAEQFVPEEDTDPTQPFVVQGWGIVDNISRRAVRDFPKDPYAHMLRARSLATSGLEIAAIHHLRRTVDLKEDIFEAWEMLAALEQRRLESLASSDPEAAAQYLDQVERLHARAVELWSDRPIEPGLPEALFTVAEGLYLVGEVERAIELLERSLKIEPMPDALDLLGTIALKRGRYDTAAARYEDLASQAYENELVQLQWEARARTKLGEIASRRGDTTASTEHFRLALRHINELLALPGMPDATRADRLITRGRLLFALGDVDLAMDDFQEATRLAPESVNVYADPLRYVVAHGYYDEAQALYRRAMEQGALSDSLKLYFTLWMNELALRQGRPNNREAERFWSGYEGDTWGSALASHARGNLSFQELLDTADGRGERAEAFFYEGLKRWRSGEAGQAKELMRQVLDTQMMGFFEYDMAQSYLEWGELPRAARPPLTASSAKASKLR